MDLVFQASWPSRLGVASNYRRFWLGAWVNADPASVFAWEGIAFPAWSTLAATEATRVEVLSPFFIVVPIPVGGLAPRPT